MDDLRYPIGPLSFSEGALTDEARKALIDAIEAHPARMRAAVKDLDDRQLDTSYRDGGWTLRQVVHHVVDSHLNAYQRFKLALTEEKATIREYNEKAWAELPEAKSGPVEMSLTLLEALHLRWVTTLRGMSPEDFQRVVDYPGMGDLTLDRLLEIYGWHGPHHEAHVTSTRERLGW